ncbi:zonular occludens toxin domain-containing protein [Patulibacter medicamentivorans]|uniref:zonular occludens toxin domain-containing protein n=1 Tax=Patulibacter medicamentivorans TaxID=1097667 RepID=UPI001110F05D|nr:zonular occludens toxin domain-containing protein [Patulibacter medicamentivorans]
MAIVEGPPGSGKSFSCVRRIAAALDAGIPVATNIALSDGWEERLAKANPFRRVIPGRTTAYARSYPRRFHSSADITELMSIRLKGSKEGRGVMVLDEAHVWLNARSWKDSDRNTYLRFFSAHRHLGWDIYLITQRAESIDAQIRALAEYRIFLRNLKRVKVAGMPIFPMNLFVAIWTWESIANSVVKREVYRLDKRARLYNTLALASAADLIPENPIWLPRDDAGTPEAGAPIAGTESTGGAAGTRSVPAESPALPAPDDAAPPETEPASDPEQERPQAAPLS